MKKLSLILVFLIGTVLTSCSNFQFQGEWSGLYTGKTDNGSWTANIDENGVINGKATSSVFNITYELIGKVDSDGYFTAVYENSTFKGEYKGQFNENAVKGTWYNTNKNLSGNLSGNKQ